jgi:hypothetical protein
MTDLLVERDGWRFFECDAGGSRIAAERDAVDIIGAAFTARPDWIVIPVARLGAGFLDLKTGVAGAVLQKFVNYEFRVAILGDVSAATAASKPLADFVRETNRGKQIWFVPDWPELMARLAR